ncbi:glutamate N-acetyltransferase amino acid acetyltransferase [Leptospira interrogans serovar Copenhageni str. Fiocruz L1-130]|uniref:Arginine biosynthesis bifunctional protein ArgJ n=17 Tax=Leptospira interrogans TaxID=173 RepID=ARGJ_LEPIC|nr:RecName: Full=Arginine biosynthesis bifunctional protein ArgJ; Includes: RecName: Full=Glutamate N-acetyltransferase; AltName: Full=Ornithine acetyltransferase; Short=OATase; AltName: Full=Ornithine transacetylase; Includes: RecName: Full=Amino-acid acetyltransferase; AltName: Full=N-acetylglutamate synthase; Short=AGSase; Contains: RecName: Full=Arginine biosynthesis bifunctional protein ArgJ alpha chain; Contains: RecName: Full=Arginine biosynthesis bifunctional protein ArgJ beta chain [Leptos
MHMPKGFLSFGINIGIKDDTKDFGVIYSEIPCKATAVFTKNNFPGAPVIVGKEHVRSGVLQAIVINSKNSNVATGEKGIQNSREICKIIGESLDIKETLVLPSSTGVIGVPLKMEIILPACKKAKSLLKPGNLEEVAEAIMTTDTRKKISSRNIKTKSGQGTIYGIAKGAGMIEPNMATMLCYILSDVSLPEGTDLYSILKSSVDQSFNCLTIDSDTSTSDTVALLCNGLSGESSVQDFSKALTEICIDLTKLIATDGEGATKLIELTISGAKSEAQARKIGKSILNSPLVKTAIYGGDPNWGRLIMAVGKVFDEPIPFEGLQIYFGTLPVKEANPETLKKLSEYLKNNTEISLNVVLNVGTISMKFWGCDFTEKYIEENAYYTT